MALRINYPPLPGLAPQPFYARVTPQVRKTRHVPPDIEAGVAEAVAAKRAAGLTPDETLRHTVGPDKDAAETLRKVLDELAHAERKRLSREVDRLSPHTECSVAVVEMFASPEAADTAGTRPLIVERVKFDVDLSDGAPSAFAQAYAAVKADARFAGAEDI